MNESLFLLPVDGFETSTAYLKPSQAHSTPTVFAFQPFSQHSVILSGPFAAAAGLLIYSRKFERNF
jgi:hypothetical protein